MAKVDMSPEAVWRRIDELAQLSDLNSNFLSKPVFLDDPGYAKGSPKQLAVAKAVERGEAGHAAQLAEGEGATDDGQR